MEQSAGGVDLCQQGQPHPPRCIRQRGAGETSEGEHGIVLLYRSSLVLCDQKWTGLLARVDLGPEPPCPHHLGEGDRWVF